MRDVTCVEKLPYTPEYDRTVIPNLGYAYPQGYEPGHLFRGTQKKLNNGGKRHIHTYINRLFIYSYNI